MGITVQLSGATPGVPQDRLEAQRWMRLAAEQGDSNTQTLLGMMYAHGEEFPQDFKEAGKWYRLAAAQGDPIAVNEIHELGKRIAL